MDLNRQLGVSYNTVWMVNAKLMQAMRERDDSQPLWGSVVMDDAYLGGEAVGGKRGRGAALPDGGTSQRGRAAAAAAAEPGGRLSPPGSASLARLHRFGGEMDANLGFFDHSRRCGSRKPLHLNDDDFPTKPAEAVVVP